MNYNTERGIILFNKEKNKYQVNNYDIQYFHYDGKNYIIFDRSRVYLKELKGKVVAFNTYGDDKATILKVYGLKKKIITNLKNIKNDESECVQECENSKFKYF